MWDRGAGGHFGLPGKSIENSWVSPLGAWSSGATSSRRVTHAIAATPGCPKPESRPARPTVPAKIWLIRTPTGHALTCQNFTATIFWPREAMLDHRTTIWRGRSRPSHASVYLTLRPRSGLPANTHRKMLTFTKSNRKSHTTFLLRGNREGDTSRKRRRSSNRIMNHNSRIALELGTEGETNRLPRHHRTRRAPEFVGREC